MTVKTDPLTTIKDWCEFGEHRAYVLMGIARRKHNKELTHSTEIVYRKVLRNEDHIERKYGDLKSLINQHDYIFRIYLTVNARNTLDAYFNFQERLNGWARDYINGDDSVNKKLGKVDSYWISTLHNPRCKDDPYFLYDLDDVTEDEVGEFGADLAELTRVLLEKETPNGYHVLVEPFNHTKFNPSVEFDEMDTDGQLFIEEIQP